jgi:CRP-like cAMP-binding protein
LFEAGEDVVTPYLPCYSTMASLLVVTRDGDEIEVASIGREGAIGGIVSAGFKPAYGRAVVRIPGSALCIPTNRLEEAKLQSPALADLFSRYADVLLAQMMQSSACNALHSIDQRMCRWLLSAHDRANDETIRLTQETLADMLGVQRTTVTAVIKALQDEGLIRTGRGRIEILDRPAWSAGLRVPRAGRGALPADAAGGEDVGSSQAPRPAPYGSLRDRLPPEGEEPARSTAMRGPDGRTDGEAVRWGQVSELLSAPRSARSPPPPRS